MQSLLRPVEIKPGLASRPAPPGGCRLQHQDERRPSLASQTGGGWVGRASLPGVGSEPKRGRSAKARLSGMSRFRRSRRRRGRASSRPAPQPGCVRLGPLRGAAQLLAGRCLSREAPRKGPVEENGGQRVGSGWGCSVLPLYKPGSLRSSAQADSGRGSHPGVPTRTLSPLWRRREKSSPRRLIWAPVHFNQSACHQRPFSKRQLLNEGLMELIFKYI